jgi:hypothetical protein
MGKKSRSESGMNIQDYISESLENNCWVKILEFFYSDAEPDTGIFLTLNPRWKKFGSGIRDKHPGSTTLDREHFSFLENLHRVCYFLHIFLGKFVICPIFLMKIKTFAELLLYRTLAYQYIR